MSDDEDVETLAGRVPAELKRLVDADERDNQEVMRAALYTEYGGLREGSLERRVREQENRVEMIEGEIRGLVEELREEQEELDRLQSKLESVREKEDEYEEQLREKAELVPEPPNRTVDHPAVKAQAKQLGMEPEEFIDELAERDL